MQPNETTGATNPEQERFSIIGSGVIGLLVARELAEQGHSVTVVSGEGKPNLDTDSTSAIAVGQFLPWVPAEHQAAVLGDMPLKEVVETTRSFYEKLAEDPHQSGVMPVRNVELVTANSSWPAGLPEAMKVDSKTLDKPVIFTDPDGSEVPFDNWYEFDTFSINSRKTVAYLADLAEAAGVEFRQQKLQPEDIEALDGIIINAAGIGAHEFDPTRAVNHFKGHTFVLQPGPDAKPLKQAISVEDLIIMPREDGTIVCGALYIENPDQPIPEEEEATQLQTRLKKLIQELSAQIDDLDPDLLAKSEVLLHSAGYRVEQKSGGIRIAPDEHNERLVHAYGFGGIGWSVGPQLAKKIAAMAKDKAK